MVQKTLSQLETLARCAQLKYMRQRQTCEVIEPGRIRFHPVDCRDRTLTEYQARLQKLHVV